jgi:integrase
LGLGPVSEWFAAKERDWRPNTRTDYKWSLELHLLPFFGDYLLAAIDAETVDRYAAAKQREGALSNNSINKTLTRLSQILETALDYEKITRNPAKGKKRRLNGEVRSRPHVEPEQLPSLLAACSGEFRPLVATLAGAGLRISEAVSLIWSNVNLAAGTLSVEDSKTAAGVRVSDLPDGLASELRSYKARGHKTAASDPVFRKRDGYPQTVRNAEAWLKVAIRRANRRLGKLGIEPISEGASPHSLRRTYASLRFAAGDDPVYVIAQLGHTDVGFSMSVYARAVKRRSRLSGALLEEFEKASVWALLGTTAPLDSAGEAANRLLERVA